LTPSWGARFAVALALLASACASSTPAFRYEATQLRGEETWLRDDVYVQRLQPGIWRHVSYRTYPDFGPVLSNGLIVTAANGALLVDTAWTPEQTEAILDWAGNAVGPVVALIVTHAHDDRMGGIRATARRGIESYALVETVSRADSEDGPAIDHGADSIADLETRYADALLVIPGHGEPGTTDLLAHTQALLGR
jgi:glyoxylase-like metal-dependent hydrolase (beta-lactamase superfamily II)